MYNYLSYPPTTPGRVLIGQGMSDYGVNFNNGSTGGEYSHTLSQQELPSFNISGNTSRVDLVGKWSSTTSGNASVFGQYGKDGFGIVKIESHYGEATRAGDSSTTGRNFVIDASHTHTVNLSFNSQNKSFKTISPYLVVYIWKRKA